MNPVCGSSLVQLRWKTEEVKAIVVKSGTYLIDQVERERNGRLDLSTLQLTSFCTSEQLLMPKPLLFPLNDTCILFLGLDLNDNDVPVITQLTVKTRRSGLRFFVRMNALYTLNHTSLETNQPRIWPLI